METSGLDSGCEFPTLDPFSEEAMRFHQDMPKVVCEGVDWVECYVSMKLKFEKVLTMNYVTRIS